MEKSEDVTNSKQPTLFDNLEDTADESGVNTGRRTRAKQMMTRAEFEHTLEQFVAHFRFANRALRLLRSSEDLLPKIADRLARQYDPETGESLYRLAVNDLKSLREITSVYLLAIESERRELRAAETEDRVRARSARK